MAIACRAFPVGELPIREDQIEAEADLRIWTLSAAYGGALQWHNLVDPKQISVVSKSEKKGKSNANFTSFG